MRFGREVTPLVTPGLAHRNTTLSSGPTLLERQISISVSDQRSQRAGERREGGGRGRAHLYVGQTVTPGAVAGFVRRLTVTDLPARQMILEVAGGDSEEVHTARVVGLQSQGSSVVMDGPSHVSL